MKRTPGPRFNSNFVFRIWPFAPPPVGPQLGLVLAVLTALAGFGWWALAETASDQDGWEVELRAFERDLLRQRSPESTDERRRGAEPWRMLPLLSPDRVLVLLRHTSEVVLLDSELRLLDRLPTPRSPGGLALLPSGEIVVGGELSDELLVLRASDSRLTTVARARVDDAVSIRDVLFASGRLYLVDDFQRQLLVGRLTGAGATREWRTETTLVIGSGADRLLQVDESLLALLVAHQQQILLVPIAPGEIADPGPISIQFEGPLFGMTVGRWDGETWLLAGGLENRALDRTEGEFGYVDSFLFGLRLGAAYPDGPRWRPEWRLDESRWFEINLSDFDVVTPRGLVAEESDIPVLWVAGFGSGRLVRLERRGRWHLSSGFTVPAGVEQLALVAKEGSAGLLAVSSLRDTVLRVGPGAGTGLWKAPDPLPRDNAERLGELLFATTLLTPHNSSRGSLSRFTCEACHVEGGIDGRVHFTGRDDVHASTKTLRGMADTVPLFSRGGDPDFASMVPAEFEAANQGRKGVFTLNRADVRWLAGWPGIGPVIGPLDQRRALIAFLLSLGHRPSAWRMKQKRLNAPARAGLSVFRDRCEHCHQARETTRVRSPIAFADWASHIERGHDPVWGAPFFSKTGIEPYVDPAGARVPSLRRTWLKRPYFTDGSSPSIADVLQRFRYRELEAWHHLGDADPEGIEVLTPSERRLLEALLRYF